MMGTEVGLEGYRKDRRNQRGGGVLVYVPESFLSWRRIDLEMEGIEAIWIEIRFQKREVLMCTAYCPPGASRAVIGRICEMFEVATQEGKEMVVMDDFNCNVLHPDSYPGADAGS